MLYSNIERIVVECQQQRWSRYIPAHATRRYSGFLDSWLLTSISRRNINGEAFASWFAARLALQRRRRLFVTTVTLDSAIAAAATIGESKPKAATGIPTAL